MTLLASVLSAGDGLFAYAWYLLVLPIGLGLAVIWLVVVVVLGMPGPLWLLVPLLVGMIRMANQPGRSTWQHVFGLLVACLSLLMLVLGALGAILAALMGNLNGTHPPVVYAFDEWNKAVYSLGAVLLPPESDVAAVSSDLPALPRETPPGIPWQPPPPSKDSY